jgi:ribosomal-protein-alanine N-acetyltransferase
MNGRETPAPPGQAPQRASPGGNLARRALLRPLGQESLPQVLALERLGQDDLWTAENFLSELGRPFTLARGLWLSQYLAGLSLSWLLPPECHLLKLMVHPRLWGRGLGRLLMRDLIDAAGSRQATRIILEVKVGNLRAERLYGDLGFTGSGLRRGYYSDGSNALLMALDLPGPHGAQPVATRRRRRPDGQGES